ncbi:glycosyltransferase family 4 protein [Halanaerobaculum tunisiense]
MTTSEWGGAQKFAFDFINEFKNEYDITLLTSENGLLVEKLKKSGIKIITNKNLVREISLVKDSKMFLWLLKHFSKENYGIVFCHSSKAGILGRIAAKLTGCSKVLFKAGGFVFNEPLPFYKRKLYEILEYMASLFSDKIVCVSSKDIETAKEINISSNKLVEISNGLKINNYNKKIYMTSTKLDDNEQGGEFKYIVSIANFYKNKGHQILIKALSKLKEKYLSFEEIKVILVGGGPLKRKMKKEVEKYGLNKDITFVGKVKDVTPYLNIADLFIIPSLKEGMPFSLLEAMAFSLPIIATRVGAMPDVIKNKKEGILIEPNNEEAIIEALIYLLNNEDSAEELGERAKQKLLEKYTYKQMMKQYEKILNGK